MNMKRPNIVILGAGFGGLITAVNLQKTLSAGDANITLINKHDYHYQTTWLHEPAAGTMKPDQARIYINDVVNPSRVKFVKGIVDRVDTTAKQVLLVDGSAVEYDYVVFALGGVPETFGIPGLKEHAMTISSLNSVRKIKEHIEYSFAQYKTNGSADRSYVTIVVGGAGFTGIEFLGELVNRVPELCKQYDVPREAVRIVNIEAAPTVLPGFDPELTTYAQKWLERNGVEMKLGNGIKGVEPGVVTFGPLQGDTTETIEANTILWTGGVSGSPIVEKSGFEAVRNRVMVEADNRAPGHDNVFIIGDCSAVMDPVSNRPYPPTAQIATQQAHNVAKNIAALINGKSTSKFTYESKGTVASLGHNDGIGIVMGKKIFGRNASFMKKVIDNKHFLELKKYGLVLKKGKF